MTQPVSDQYFHTGAFTSAGPELFSSYTCLGCGVRLKTWEGFDAHRRECSGRLSATGAVFGAGLMDRLHTLATDPPPVTIPQRRIEVPAPLSFVAATRATAATGAPAATLFAMSAEAGGSSAELLAASVAQAPAAPLVDHDPFLDAPPAALILLERWRQEEEQQVLRDAA